MKHEIVLYRIVHLQVLYVDKNGWIAICNHKGKYEGERVTLFTGNNKRIVQDIGNEARNCAILDCASSSTVCRQKWMDCYLQS